MQTVNNQNFQMHHPEDVFIEQMAMGKLLVKDSMDGQVRAGSLEGIIAEVIRVRTAECQQRLSLTAEMWNVRSYFIALPCPPSFQDAEKDIQCTGFPYSHPHHPLISMFSNSSDGYHHHHHHQLRHEPSTSSGVSSQHQCDQEHFDDLTRRSFREYFLHAVPLVVHPIIILRVLCHKMFGSMLRRKTTYSAQNLSPPCIPVLENESCPPRAPLNAGGATEGAESKDKDGTPTMKRRKTNLHVQIAMPNMEDEEEQIRYIRRRTRRAGSMG